MLCSIPITGLVHTLLDQHHFTYEVPGMNSNRRAPLLVYWQLLLIPFEEIEMKRALLLGGALTAMLGAAPFMAAADNSTSINPGATQIADTMTNANGEVDAGKLIGKE